MPRSDAPWNAPEAQDYTARHKKTPKFLSPKLEEKWTNFNQFWYEFYPLAIKWLFSFPPHPLSVSALPGERKRTIYCILTTLLLLLNQNNTQNTHFVHIFIVLADSLSNWPFFNCLQKSFKCWPTNMARLGNTFSIRW